MITDAYHLIRKDHPTRKQCSSSQFTVSTPYNESKLNERGLQMYQDALQRWKEGDVTDRFAECTALTSDGGSRPYKLKRWEEGKEDLCYIQSNVVLIGTLKKGDKHRTSAVLFLNLKQGFALTKSGALYSFSPSDIKASDDIRLYFAM